MSRLGAKELADLCARGHGWRLFNELTFSTPPEWIPLMPKPGEFNHPEYGKISITAERNANFIANFDSGVYQTKLPINAEHNRTDGGAFGWIVGMRHNTDGSVDAKVSWTDLGTAAIENDRFGYISPEWFDEWEQKSTGDTFKDVVIGAALTVRPFFKEDSLRPLVASERGLAALDKGRNEMVDTLHVFSEGFDPDRGKGKTALDKMNAEAKKLTEANPKLTHEKAFSIVLEQQPKLYGEYLNEPPEEAHQAPAAEPSAQNYLSGRGLYEQAAINIGSRRATDLRQKDPSLTEAGARARVFCDPEFYELYRLAQERDRERRA